MEGTGSKGWYGGEKCTLKNAKVAILPVPFDQTTTYQKGTDKGPAALIEASRNMELYDVETGTEVIDVGIFTAPAIKAKSSKAMLKNTYEKTREFLKQNKFVVTLGGEHSISPAPIRAHAEKYPGMTVLQFDAHADLAPAYEGNPLSHASAISRVREIPGVSRVISVGIRSMSKEESRYLDRAATFFAHEIQEDDEWMDRVLKQCGSNVYITFDLDAFDASIMPSTGTPEPGGLSWYPVMKLLKRVALEKKIVGLDVVELLPRKSDPAPDFLAAKLVYKILTYRFMI